MLAITFSLFLTSRCLLGTASEVHYSTYQGRRTRFPTRWADLAAPTESCRTWGSERYNTTCLAANPTIQAGSFSFQVLPEQPFREFVLPNTSARFQATPSDLRPPEVSEESTARHSMSRGEHFRNHSTDGRMVATIGTGGVSTNLPIGPVRATAERPALFEESFFFSQFSPNSMRTNRIR
jgi:hypothetical protein